MWQRVEWIKTEKVGQATGPVDRTMGLWTRPWGLVNQIKKSGLLIAVGVTEVF